MSFSKIPRDRDIDNYGAGDTHHFISETEAYPFRQIIVSKLTYQEGKVYFLIKLRKKTNASGIWRSDQQVGLNAIEFGRLLTMHVDEFNSPQVG